MKDNASTKRLTRTEYSAGGIVFRRTSRVHAERANSPAQRGGIEIAFLLDPFRKWTFAKGHIERGESIKSAAVREVKEELGIKVLRVVAPLGRIDWWFKERRGTVHSPRGAMVHKFAYYFLMETPSHTVLRAQKSELIRAVRWVPLSSALRFSNYKDVKPVLRRALDILVKMM